MKKFLSIILCLVMALGSFSLVFADTAANQFNDQIIAKSEVDLTIQKDGKSVAGNQETNLGDFCADAYRAVLGADIAFVNGGGIAADILAGDVSYGQISSVHPFGNTMCVARVSGQQIKDALERGACKAPVEFGGFLQVSGLTYAIDTTRPSRVVFDDQGSFVKVDGAYRVSDIMIGDSPLELNKKYTVASNNYILKSAGDGFGMFGLDKIELVKDEAMLDSEVLIEYIVNELGGVIGEEYKDPQERIKFVKDYSSDYIDVAYDASYRNAIHTVVQKGFMNGVNGTEFYPDGFVTKEMYVTILYRLAGSPEVLFETTNFYNDTVPGAYYMNAVTWMEYNNIVHGLEPHTFGVGRELTIVEMKSILKGFTKVVPGSFSMGLYDENSLITRAQLAEILASYTK